MMAADNDYVEVLADELSADEAIDRYKSRIAEKQAIRHKAAQRAGLITGKDVQDFKRARMEKYLHSWGVFIHKGPTAMGVRQACMDGDRISDLLAYDSLGMSDHDCFMVHISQTVDALNPSDRDLMIAEYVDCFDTRSKDWETRYGKLKGRYKRRKHELLNKFVQIYIE